MSLEATTDASFTPNMRTQEKQEESIAYDPTAEHSKNLAPDSLRFACLSVFPEQIDMRVAPGFERN